MLLGFAGLGYAGFFGGPGKGVRIRSSLGQLQPTLRQVEQPLDRPWP
jgi:hypothetical protein